MKKYVYLILTLLFAASFMGACKPSRSVESHTDAVSVQSLSVKDSLHTDFRFLFDQLDMWTFDSLHVDSDAKPWPTVVKHISITGGNLHSTKSLKRQEAHTDSTLIKEQDVIHPVSYPPKLQTLVILILAIVLLFTILSRL